MADDLSLVAETQDEEIAHTLALELAPDITVLSASAETPFRGAVVERLSAVSRLVYVGACQPDVAHQAITCGAAAVFDPRGRPQALPDIIRVAAANDTLIMPTCGPLKMTRIPTATKASEERDLPLAPDALTNREAEVLLLLAQGYANQEIANKLSVSSATIRSHVHHLLTKLSVRSRAHAVALAYESGLIRAVEQGLRQTA
ncbi:response regulator transcription factor [Kitasatospora griseola]|uniref:response regulator transcription factor n=1 Tax=Kitasatospora griseola TaxID=2064 RepID=UPI0016713CB3|nr:response regulator transcription factor [Kitasatospora griseola]GGQ54679.1 DNA-binding response regulator [Kitasatospora griseola]